MKGAGVLEALQVLHKNRRSVTRRYSRREDGLFGKIFTSLWEGTLLGKSDEQLVFVYLLSHADAEGMVEAYRPLISIQTGLSPERVDAALAGLEGPDPKSRTPDMEGRRIVRLEEHRDWAWAIVNYAKYRGIKNAETLREKGRARMRRYRERRAVEDAATNGKAESKAVARVEEESVPLEGPVEVGSNGEESVKEWAKGFDDFWADYPRKVGKEVARVAYLKLRPRTQETYDLLFAGLKLHMRTEWADREPDKIPHASTWLNQRRYLDAAQS